MNAADKQEKNIGEGRNKGGGEYWQELATLSYANAEEANSVTFKEFIYTHVRLYLPGEYKGLISEWGAISKWKDINYLVDKIGHYYVEGVHYQGFKPYRNYAGGHIFKN